MVKIDMCIKKNIFFDGGLFLKIFEKANGGTREERI
jgi:hypothetical protein